jgi:hypothetical protein
MPEAADRNVYPEIERDNQTVSVKLAENRTSSRENVFEGSKKMDGF